MKKFSGEEKGGGAYFEFHIQQGRLIEGGRLFEEIRYFRMLHVNIILNFATLQSYLLHPTLIINL